MIDIHSHILPNIDDGARDLTEALDMLKMAVDNGVTQQLLTPHIQPGRYDNTKEQIVEKFTQFVDEVDKANISVKLLLGAEVRIGTEVMAMINNNQIPWLGEFEGKKTFLLEFPRAEVPFGSDNLVRWALSKNCLPIIVHPERNSTFMNNPDKLQVFLDLACPIQLTSCSLTGRFGADVQRFAEQLLLDGKVSAIASDCHNLKGRKPDLHEGYERAKLLVGENMAMSLVSVEPSKLIQNNQYGRVSSPVSC